MKKELAAPIRLRIAITLNKLLQRSEPYQEAKNDVDPVATSYAMIALYADIRKATVSDTFNAQSTPGSDTLILIINAMGFTLPEFAAMYELVNDSDIQNFKKQA